MKGAGMLIVSLRGVNLGFWSHLGCSGKNAITFKGGKFLKKMWCCAGGEYYKIIWFVVMTMKNQSHHYKDDEV